MPQVASGTHFLRALSLSLSLSHARTCTHARTDRQTHTHTEVHAHVAINLHKYTRPNEVANHAPSSTREGSRSHRHEDETHRPLDHTGTHKYTHMLQYTRKQVSKRCQRGRSHPHCLSVLISLSRKHTLRSFHKSCAERHQREVPGPSSYTCCCSSLVNQASRSLKEGYANLSLPSQPLSHTHHAAINRPTKP